VYLVIRHDDLGRDMSRYLVEQIEANPRIHVLRHSEVRELIGDGNLEAIRVEDLRTGESHRLEVRALFVFIGAMPCTQWLVDGGADGVALDEDGFVLTGERVTVTGETHPLFLESNWPGVFAAGDVRSGSIKRVASAVGEGAMAVRLVHERLA
jgi:thioredoxin reductase (NADPH)